MRVGTPLFVKERLIECREALGMSAATLASLTNISRQLISLYENGHRTPSPESLEILANALKVPSQRLLKPVRSIRKPTFFWRSMASSTKTERARAERIQERLDELLELLLERVRLPEVKFVKFDTPSQPEAILDSDIERMAVATRRHWGLGDRPISNVVWLFENNGAIVARQDMIANSLDAFSNWLNHYNRPLITLGSHKATAFRSRFDASHELAHVVIHHTYDGYYLRKTDTFSLIEKQANQFASAFLLPAETFCNDISTVSLDVFRSIKSKWKVSIAAMIERAYQLNVISGESRRRLWMSYNRRGWRRCEPLDDTMQPEQPQLIQQAIDILFKKSVISPSELVTLLQLPSDAIEECAGLPEGYIANKVEPIIELKHSLNDPSIFKRNNNPC